MSHGRQEGGTHRRSVRRCVEHLLLFVGGLLLLAAMVSEPGLETLAGPLLAFWGVGLGLWGGLFLWERHCERVRRQEKTSR